MMKAHVERELKLDEPLEFSLARLSERLDGCRAALKLGRCATLLDVARASMGRSIERIVRYDAAIRSTHDAEAVHKARTSVRRLRSDMRTFEAAFETGYARGLAERLRWLGDAYGEARDADVFLARIERDVHALPEDDAKWTSEAIASFRSAREAAYGNVVHALRDPQYVALLDDLLATIERPPRGPRATSEARDAGPGLLDHAWRRLRKRVRKRSRPPTDAELHRIRIKAKYVRYAAEALAPVLGKRAAQLAEAAEALQRYLGDQHDASVAAHRLSEPRDDGRATFVAGELAEREREAANAGRAGWRKPWRKLARRKAALCG